MEHITLLAVGVIICLIGASNMAGNIKTVHSYNRRKVKEEDIPKYGKTVGLGTFVIGVFMIAAFVASLFTDSDVTGYVMIPGFVIGLGFILYGQFKYNKGII
ncbi:MAG: hypothetical protein ACI4P4_14635 [Faecousia sp.]